MQEDEDKKPLTAAELERTHVKLILHPDTFAALFVALRKNKPIEIEGLDGQVISFKIID